jgi:NADPH2:quinone reductase
MRAVVLQRQTSGPVAEQVRCVEDWPDPGPPGPGELQLRTICSALNHMDLWVGRGIPGVELRYPHVSGSDGCGIVEAVGNGVDDAWLGQRVIHNSALVQPLPSSPDSRTGVSLAPSIHLLGEHVHGSHRERYNIPVLNAVGVGELDPVDAAAFGLVGLTAYSMMISKGQLRPGQRVMITGIGGGVATAALAIARWMGCEIFVSSRHRWKLERALELGAHHAILDEGHDWSAELRSRTQKRGVDMVVDTIGRHCHLPALKSLARGGAYVTAGATSGSRGQTDLARIFWNQLRVLGSTMGTTDELREITALVRAGQLRPVVDCAFDWTDAADAWQRLESGAQMGKIVLRWG